MRQNAHIWTSQFLKFPAVITCWEGATPFRTSSTACGWPPSPN